MLYTENLFKTTTNHHILHLPNYLLKDRLHGIRHFHCILNLADPWTGLRQCFQALAQLKGLLKLRVEGVRDGLVDGEDRVEPNIDLSLWEEKRHHILSHLPLLDFVRDFDLYLPITENNLGEDVQVGNCRIHGTVWPASTAEHVAA